MVDGHPEGSPGSAGVASESSVREMALLAVISATHSTTPSSVRRITSGLPSMLLRRQRAGRTRGGACEKLTQQIVGRTASDPNVEGRIDV
jgi:hypothetical protein